MNLSESFDIVKILCISVQLLDWIPNNKTSCRHYLQFSPKRGVGGTPSAFQPLGCIISAAAISWDRSQSDLPRSWGSLCEVSGAVALSFLKSSVVRFVSGHNSPQNLKTQFHNLPVKWGVSIQSWYFNSCICWPRQDGLYTESIYLKSLSPQCVHICHKTWTGGMKACTG